MNRSTSEKRSKPLSISRRELSGVIKNSNYRQYHAKFDWLKDEMKRRCRPSDHELKEFNSDLNTFIFQFKSRWHKSNRREERFLPKNQSWLDGCIEILKSRHVKRGRKEIPFEEASEGCKRNKVKELRQSVSLPMLVYATQMSLRASGEVEASKLVQEITKKVCSKGQLSDDKPKTFKMLSNEEALGVFVEAKLSEKQYEIIRNAAPEKFPPFNEIQSLKKDTDDDTI